MPQKFTHDDVKVSKIDSIYKGFLSLKRYHLQYRLFNNEWSREHSIECLERNEAVVILPYDPIRDEVLLVTQFRMGAYPYKNVSPWIIEAIAGGIEEGETADAVAHREAKEEAGVELTALYPINNVWVSPGGCTERAQIYIGQFDATHAGGVFGLADENENILAEIYSFDKAVEMMNDGIIATAPPIIALQWLIINKAKLLASWSSNN